MRFVFLKLWAYLLYSAPIVVPTFAINNYLDGALAIAACVAWGMIAIHVMITQDSETAHQTQRLLFMRKRHFSDMPEKDKKF